MKEPKDDTGTFVGERPASLGAGRVLLNPRWSHRVRDVLTTLAWVVPLTLLIWLYAEREQLSRTTLVVSVQLTPGKPNEIITPSRTTATLTLTGPRARLESLRASVTGQPLALPVLRSPGRDHELQLTTLLSDLPALQRSGITVTKCEPAILNVFVDEYVEREVPVTAPALRADLQAPPVFEPRSVRVRAPATELQRRLAAGEPIAVAEMATLPQLRQPGTHTVPSVPIRPLGETVSFSPASVKVEFGIVEQQTRQYRIPSVIIEVRKPLAVEGKLLVDVNPAVLTNVEVVGPAAVIDQMERDAVRGIAPVAILRISAENIAARRGTKSVQFDLPEGVRVVGELRNVEFTITEAPARER
jgi:hypothetical protein